MLRVPFTPQAVDKTVEKLCDRLEWATKPATPAPAPPSAESVRLLPNGEPELQLNASVAEMRAGSKTQLQDLSRRRGEGRQSRLGTFSSKF
jgi:hypothetical protein